MTFDREPCEVERGVGSIFDVFPRGTWPWLLGFLALAVLAGAMLAGCGGGDPARRDPGDVVVAKGCRCRHSLATAPPGALGWAQREWHPVSFEDWERANVGDPWPLRAPLPASAPATRIIWPELEAAVR